MFITQTLEAAIGHQFDDAVSSRSNQASHVVLANSMFLPDVIDLNRCIQSILFIVVVVIFDVFPI
jgi:hypothetical protein